MNILITRDALLVAFLLYTTICQTVRGQSLDDYYQFAEQTKKANSLFAAQDYAGASDVYSKILNSPIPQHRVDWFRYKAAGAYSMSGYPDRAFDELEILAQGKCIFKEALAMDLHGLQSDSNFSDLHNDPRWSKLILDAELLAREIARGLDSTLIRKINHVAKMDQDARFTLQKVKSTFGIGSKEHKNAMDNLRIIDSLNLSIADSIIRIHGWPGMDLVGIESNFNLFLIIQHSDYITQEKYLPLITRSIETGKTLPGILPLIVDKIELHKTGLQVFGTQTCQDRETNEFYVCPMVDPDRLDDRRVMMGMSTYSDELKPSGMIWDLEEYKQKLPDYIQIYRRDSQ